MKNKAQVSVSAQTWARIRTAVKPNGPDTRIIRLSSVLRKEKHSGLQQLQK
jgi:hypothetical protein